MINFPLHKTHDHTERDCYFPHHLVHKLINLEMFSVRSTVLRFMVLHQKRFLLGGTNLLHHFLFILVRFRQHQVAVSVDTEEMLFQTDILPEYQPPLFFVAGRVHIRGSFHSIHTTLIPRENLAHFRKLCIASSHH